MKTRKFLLSGWLGVCLGLPACGADSNDGNVPAGETEPETETLLFDMVTAAEQANDFAIRFYDRIASDDPGNLFFSPLSIHAALSMTYAGARGETAEQMREVLAFQFGPEEGTEHAAYSTLLKALNSPATTSFETIVERERRTVERPAFELVVANRLWGQEGFEWDPGYIQRAAGEYLAGLAEVDFRGNAEGARNTINAWVEETTRDRIKDLIPSGALDTLTRLVLTNAIYFKANWQDVFEERNSKSEPFHLADGSTRDVPMMHQAERFGYAESADWQALAMPYEQNALSMLVILPADREGAMAAAERQLVSGELLDALGSPDRPKVRVWLPKFRLTRELDLGTTLQAMGILLAFSDQADFSGMTPEAELYISKALHKAFVEVDEKGTEAAAATAVVMSLTSAPMEPEQPKVFRADRPFIFLIRHNPSGAILFMGRVMDPR